MVVDKSNDNKVKAVKGVDADGNMETVEPTAVNQGEFIRIDDKDGILENFFLTSSVNSKIQAILTSFVHLSKK